MGVLGALPSGEYGEYWEHFPQGVWSSGDSLSQLQSLYQVKPNSTPTPGSVTATCTPPDGRTSMVWHSLLVMKPGCAGGRGFAPRPGNSNESFSPCQETGNVFSSVFYSKFGNRPRGEVVSYRSSASPSYEAPSHAKINAY